MFFKLLGSSNFGAFFQLLPPVNSNVVTYPGKCLTFSLAEPRAHEVRAVSATLALMRGTALEDVLRAVDWRTDSTFIRHYLRQLDLPDTAIVLPS